MTVLFFTTQVRVALIMACAVTANRVQLIFWIAEVKDLCAVHVRLQDFGVDAEGIAGEHDESVEGVTGNGSSPNGGVALG